VRAEENGRTVYRKRYRAVGWRVDGEIVRRRVEREVGIIRQLHESQLFGGRLGLMTILSSDPEQASLVMDEVSGESLQGPLANYSTSRSKELLTALFLAGRWLQRFQLGKVSADACVPILDDVDPHDLVDYCDVRLKRLKDYGNGLDSALHSRLLERVRMLMDNTDESDLRFVWTHGDYAPGNLMWDGRTLTPIDFATVQANRPLQDVTYLIHRLEMFQIYRPWRSWPIRSWTAAVLRGYGRPDAEESPMYQAMMIRHFVCRLSTYTRRPPRDVKQRLHDTWVKRVIRKRLAEMS